MRGHSRAHTRNQSVYSIASLDGSASGTPSGRTTPSISLSNHDSPSMSSSTPASPASSSRPYGVSSPGHSASDSYSYYSHSYSHSRNTSISSINHTNNNHNRRSLVFDTPDSPLSPSPFGYTPQTVNVNIDASGSSLAAPHQYSHSHSTSQPGVALGQRRGHKYRHSSVSVNFFREPPPRAPLAIPASLPVPTFGEWRQSLSFDQKVRLGWCLCHFAVAVVLFMSHSPFESYGALAHLLLFDAIGAGICAAVDALGSNFAVWKESSLHLPFGLGRLEVLAGYAMSVTLVFVGGDLISHVIQHMAQLVYSSDSSSHDHGHSHSDSSPSASSDASRLAFAVLLGMLATVVSAVVLDTSSGSGSGSGSGSSGNPSSPSLASRKTKSSSSPASPTLTYYGKPPGVGGRPRVLASILDNTLHLVTLVFSCLLLILPFLDLGSAAALDVLLTPLMALAMIYLGWNQAKSLSGMLVMGYFGSDTDRIATLVRENPLVESVSRVSLWQVHHGLWLATMKIVMSGTDDDERAMRERAAKIIGQVASRAATVARWETTIDITRTTLE